jgi:hypothetical protein
VTGAEYKARAGSEDKNPDIIRFEYVDKLFDPKHTDLFSEVTEDQRNVIAFFRALHEKFKIPVLDGSGSRVPLMAPDGSPMLDYMGRVVYAYRAGLPAVMSLCDNFLRLNVSLGRQGRKELTRILEPKASNITANPITFGAGHEEKKGGILNFLGGGKK